MITTVSPSYAEEVVKDKELTNSFNALLKQNRNRFKGIINGIDNWVWNPACDDKIDFNLSGDITIFKKKNKEALAKKIGFILKDKTPLIGMITKIDEQKGIPLFIESADKIFKEDLQLVLLGEGDNQLKKELAILGQKYSDKLKFIPSFDDELAHKIEAGSDMFLMPSLYEPCGLNLLYSLKYGAVPIAHFTGGIKDTAVKFNSKTKKGNSFVFKDYSTNGLIDTIKKALATYKDSKLWEQVMKNGIGQDFSWLKTAGQYAEIYKQIFKD